MLYVLVVFSLIAPSLPICLSILLKMSGLLVLIHFIFLPAQAFSAEWWELIQLQFEVNASALLQRNWYLLSDLFQTFIFLVVIALVSYLLYFWLVTMKKVFVFLSLTIAFVTIIDIFIF